MKSKRFGPMSGLVWMCVASLSLTPAVQTIVLAARAADAAPLVANLMIGRSADLPVTIDTHAQAGQRGRILMRLRPDGVPSGVLTVRWTARHTLAGGVAQSGDRAVVFDGPPPGPSIDEVMTFEIRSTSKADAGIDILPEFEFEPAGRPGQAVSLKATGADGLPIRVALTPARVFAGAPQATLWEVQTPEAEPMPTGVQVTGTGVRLQRDFANTRVAFSPEVTDRHGFAFKAAVARALSSRAAFGFVGGGGGGQQDLVANFGWQISPSQRLLLSAGSMRQEIGLAFVSGLQEQQLRQSSAGGAYSFALGGKFEPRLDTQAYLASSGSRDFGSTQFFKDAGGQAQIFQQERRVAGALLTGAQTRASFSLLPASTLTVSVGAERLRYAFATGDQSTATLTRGAEWAQQIRRYTVQGFARTHAAMHTSGIAIERSFSWYGQRLGLGLTKIDGRNGVIDDLQLRLTHSVAFGGGSRPSPQAQGSLTSETNAVADALLNEVSQRPAFLPLVTLAKVDHTLQAERLVAIDHAGMVPGTEIDSVTGTVTVPVGASIITGITRNLAPFSNTGQFSAANGELKIHPMSMEQPVSGSHQYLVAMRRPDNGVTTVSVEVMRGSVHITRVSIVSEEPDTAPEPFLFPAVSPAHVSTVVTSAAVAISGLAAPAPISIVGGEYSIDGGPFTSAPGTISNGQQVVVRLSTPAAYGTTATAILTIGGVSAEFTVASEAAVSTPAPFTFVARDGADFDALVTSEEVIVAGMNVPGSVSVEGGEYSINGAPFTSVPGTISSGDAVRLRLRTSTTAATLTTATLTIGGVTGAFSVTTGELADDTTPEAFSFTAQAGTALSTLITSNSVTVSGINTEAAISITGGEYSVDAGPYTSVAGTVANGQTVTVRLTSSAAYSTQTTATLTIGGVGSAFEVTTGAVSTPVDTTPDAFSFTAQTGAALSTLTTSNGVTVSGINTDAAISITGGEYSINAGTYTSVAGTVANGQTVTVRLTSSAAYSTLTSATLTIGGVTGAFDVTTAAEPVDTTPDAFSFTAQTGAALSTLTTSNSQTVSGINAAAAISIVGGEYRINAGTYTSIAGTVTNGQTVTVRLTSSAAYSTLTSATLTIGGVTGSFNVTTQAADNTPDPFSFATKTGVNQNTTQASEAIIISGITAGTAISVNAGSEYKLNNAPWTSVAGVLNNSDTVQVRHTSLTGSLTVTVTTLTIGTVSGTFTTINKDK